ncbi:alpha/beta hydrolase family protein [Litchfieldia alkalitelluris]|uniref:alpha/beta hydrolase family protein n=1 Tax=Litchfieldia alkalitelluris TaxID=304268 RepID=UPI0009961944|nr:S9 family peptidase [Litchfieldia alkalitelluris]
MTQIRGILAEDLYELKSVGSVEMSPNGDRYAFVETKINKDKHDYISHIFIGDIESGQVTQWTFGDVRDTSPKWSPDGKNLAFVSNRSGKSQIYLLNADGGEAQQLTNCKHGARNLVWSPNSDSILFATSLALNEKVTDEVETNKEEKKLPEPMVVEQIRYKSDAVGFLDDKSQHLAMIDISTKELTQLTEGERDYTPGSWSPDGKQITFTADLTDEPDYNLVTDVFVFSLVDKNMKKLTNSNGFYGNPTWSPDGKHIAMIGHQKEFDSATLSRIWMYNIENSGLTCLTSEWDVQIGDVAIGDFHSGNSNPGIVWTEDSIGFYFVMSDRGNTGIYYGSLAGEMYPSLLEDQHIYSFSVDPKNHKAVVAISTPTHPGDLHFIDLSTGEIKQLTNSNDAFLANIELSLAESFTFKAPDGWDLHGWVMKPFGFKEGEKYPTIVEVHGGPHAMYANSYFHEFQMLTAKGFVVIFTNPRGSHGYGQHFVDAVRGDYGGKDYLDVMAAAEYSEENFDFVDSARLGVTGGSYGGFMTNWIVGHTNKFKAAVTQRSISNWLSFYGVSDIGYYFSEWEVKGDLVNDTEKLWNHSPLKYVANIETPLLILHGEKDYRCPIEQAEQLFIALKKQKKTTKFVRFPGANHELSRSGNPKLRVDRLNHIKEWFVEYL